MGRKSTGLRGLKLRSGGAPSKVLRSEPVSAVPATLLQAYRSQLRAEFLHDLKNVAIPALPCRSRRYLRTGMRHRTQSDPSRQVIPKKESAWNRLGRGLYRDSGRLGEEIR